MRNLTKTILLIFLALSLVACTHSPFSQRSDYISLTKPVSDESVLVWANEAAVSVYSYNFASYRKNLQDASAYFTPTGWKTYMQALQQSGKLKAVIEKKLVVSAVATGAPLILKKSLEQGRFTWTVEIPMLVTYQSAHAQRNYPSIITMTIVRIPPHSGKRNLGITKFIAVQK
jgi:intracellular multiplication protein IcmL